MARVSHFEQAYKDPEKAAKFYTEAFGWKFEEWKGAEIPYWMVTTGDDKEIGINGGFLPLMDATQPRVVNTVTVDDIDAACKKVEAAGGREAMPKMTLPGVGYQAYYFDPEGTMIGLHQSDPKAGK